MRAVVLAEQPPPPSWGVEVDDRALTRQADRWSAVPIERPRWDYPGLPRDLGAEAWFDFCGTACSVVACLWPPEGEPAWEVEHEGRWLTDAPALFACFTRAQAGQDLRRFLGWTEGDARAFFAGRGTIQLLPERRARLQALAEAVLDRWEGRFGNLVEESGFQAPEVVERMVESVPGYRDEAETPAGLLRFNKLAHLATAMMAARSHKPFTGLEQFPVYPDYMLPRSLRWLGILRYQPDLAGAVDGRRLIPAGSAWELAIRWATVYAAEELRRALNRRGNPVITPSLDYHLWHMAVLGDQAAALGEHHRTLTLAY